MDQERYKNIFYYINISAYVIIILFLVGIVFKAITFGHPWSLSCYVCKKCTSACIVGIDPSQLLLAANLNDPNLYITVDNLRIKAKDACTIDSSMMVTYNSSDYKLSEALKRGVFKEEDFIFTKKMKAKDAAKFCIKCRACTKICPFNLPIIEVVNELSAHK